MKTLLRKLFIDNWQRKIVALILAMIAWLVVNHSLTISKNFANIPVKIINIPHGKTIEGLQTNGFLEERLSLNLTGNKKVIDDLSSGDLEVIIDAEGKGTQWMAEITKNNLISLNKDIDISKGITKIAHQDFIIQLSDFVTDRIPILVTKPTGEAPLGYQYLDVWPYHLYITVSGPEQAVRSLKIKGYKLTFNLNDITKAELNALQTSKNTDELSFLVPNSWKKISLPSISKTPLTIDDPQAKSLRIDFALSNMLALHTPLPVSVFFPLKYSQTLNPSTSSIEINHFITMKNDIPIIAEPLFAQGVSRSFLDIVKDSLQLEVIASPKEQRAYLQWNIQVVYSQKLEDLYVAKSMSDSANTDLQQLQKHQQEEYLRNRFRNYMNRFRIYTSNEDKLALKIEIVNNKIRILPENNIQDVSR